MTTETYSGIDVLGNMPWGTHFCQFYDTKQDLLDILIPYFKTGLENNEFCLWITSKPIDIKNATYEMEKAMPDFDHYIEEQKIEILSYADWYLKDGKFNAQGVLYEYFEKLRQSLNNGFNGMRVNGNTEWLDRGIWKNFISYEEELNQFLLKKRMIVLCTYPLKKSAAANMLDVATVHDCAISKRSGQWEILELPEYKRTKAQIQYENEELEHRVKERTSQLAKTNKQLRKLSAHLQTIQENERTAMAREIHDELGQQLTALKMEVGWLQKKLRDDPTIKEKIDEILSLVSTILKSVKKIAFESRPNILDELGLISALAWQTEELMKHTGIKSEFHTNLVDFNPGENISINIFRVYQEALTNIARHARASHVVTTLEKTRGWIILTIKDNGKGFDLDAAKNKNSFGLMGMNERALMIRGKLNIETKKHAGTVITLKLPPSITKQDKS